MTAILTGARFWSHCAVDLHFPDASDVEHLSLHVPVGHLHSLFGKMSIQFFCPVFCFFDIELYILNINPLSVIPFANIFSHSVGCLFILSVVSFALQKLLSLLRSHLFIFAYISFALGDRSKKILLWFMSKSVLPIFSSRSFKVSDLTFRSWIHSEFIFVYGVR